MTDYNSFEKRLERLRWAAKPQYHLDGEPDNHEHVERADIAALLLKYDDMRQTLEEFRRQGLLR